MYRCIACVFAAMLVAGPLRADEPPPPKTLLLLGHNPDGHPVKEHEYMAGVRVIEALLKDTTSLKTQVINVTNPWPDGPELIKKADGVVLYVSEGGKWMNDDPRRLAAMVDLVARKGSVVGLHFSIAAKDTKLIESTQNLFGACHGGPDRSLKFADADVKPEKHVITTALSPFTSHDEWYYRLKFVKDSGTITPLLKTVIDGETQVVSWTWERPDGGRSVGFSGFHYHEHWQKPEYRRLVKQSILWSVGLPIPENGAAIDVPDEVLKLK